ncbi:MAG: HDOD domain-containing protein [Armatimonadetes bacterium]|nr:HDOD domain-containing protein [Armatimonadota bacterium]
MEMHGILKTTLFYKIRDLPPLPNAVLKITQLLEDTKSSASDIAELISKDEALSARILKIANSPYFGFPNPICSITHAVAILGFNLLRSVVLGVSALSLLSQEGKKDLLDRQQFWLHSIGTAIGSSLIARETKVPRTEEAFIIGLLHDMGKLILAQLAPMELSLVLERTRKENISIFEAEMKVLGTHHGEIGELAARKWRFPAIVQNAIKLHHRDPFSRGREDLSPYVYAANNLCKQGRIGWAGDYVVSPHLNEALEILGISVSGIEPLISEIKKGAEEVKNLLGIS